MAPVPDYHMHTPLCHHAVGEPSEYAAQALKLGFTEIGFSDHSPMRQDGFDSWRMNKDRLGQYVESIQKARHDHPALTIRLALEVDYLPGQEEWIRELAAMHPWDYFIGSVHYINGNFDIDNPEKISEWKKRDPYEVWSLYFESLTKAAESGLFDIIGHADLPKKFNIYPQRDCVLLFERFLQAAARHNVAIELNTAGLRKECTEIYPNPKILQMALLKNIAITFGSDAHKPEEVGMNFSEAADLAKRTGFTESCRFHKRKRTMVKF